MSITVCVEAMAIEDAVELLEALKLHGPPGTVSFVFDDTPVDNPGSRDMIPARELAVAVEPARATKQKTARPKPRDATQFPCPDCERVFGRAQGLGRHRLHAHGTPGAARRSEPVTELVLRCGQCGWETPLSAGAGDDMSEHTMLEHSRSPHTHERKPRAPLLTAAVNGHQPS
jgi:predicted RNA-binding Zn-ribbon protein involved in translation (DUF1610 family)